MAERHLRFVVSMMLVLLTSLSALAEDLPLRRYALNERGEAVVDDVDMARADADIGNNRVFYEIFVGSFSDSNGDGVGDLRGIIDRMDYLNDGDPASGLSLGVEGIWLTPIYLSPSYHKYDVSDYYTVDPAFGTMDDLRELIDLCHARGVKLILDLPINHTGSQHEWFKRFSQARLMKNDGNRYYDFYSCCEIGSVMPAGRHFTPLSNTKFAYESNFSDSMPELNFDNPEVRKAVLDIARFYLDLGVDGFRFDAAKYLYLNEHDKNVEFWQWYIGELRAIKPDVYTVAEVWDSDSMTDRYIPAVNCFNFTASQAGGIIASTAKAGNVDQFTGYVQKYTDNIHAINPASMPVLFIANHDTDRAAGFLTVASGQMQMAANLYLLSPGSPFIYYGEEIGLRGSRGAANTDANRRLAMLWDDGDTVRDPIGTTYDAKKQTPYAVSDLLGRSDSIYTYYKRLIMIRKAHPEIACGEYAALTLPDTKAGGFVSTLNGVSVAVIHNTTNRDVTLDLGVIEALSFVTALSADIGMGTAVLERGTLTISAQTSAILR